MIMHNDWDQLFDQEIQKDYLLNLRYFLAKEYKTKNIYPAKENIFAAFKTTSLKDTKVVILGQDPYHGPGQAQGYSFSVPSNFIRQSVKCNLHILYLHLYKTCIKN